MGGSGTGHLDGGGTSTLRVGWDRAMKQARYKRGLVLMDSRASSIHLT